MPSGNPAPFRTMEGSIYCSFQSVQHARCYEVQYGSNPTDQSSWSTMVVSSSRRTLITDFTPLSKGYLRIRTIGPRNIMSDYSDVIAFKVI
jgi:hypothetical protein